MIIVICSWVPWGAFTALTFLRKCVSNVFVSEERRIERDFLDINRFRGDEKETNNLYIVHLLFFGF